MEWNGFRSKVCFFSGSGVFSGENREFGVSWKMLKYSAFFFFKKNVPFSIFSFLLSFSLNFSLKNVENLDFFPLNLIFFFSSEVWDLVHVFLCCFSLLFLASSLRIVENFLFLNLFALDLVMILSAFAYSFS